MTSAPAKREVVVSIKFRGGNLDFAQCKEPEVILSGPQGTGKTRTILELINLFCRACPGMKALIVRKTHISLTSSALQTLQDKVYQGWNGNSSALEGVTFFGGSKNEASHYKYKNGSRIYVGGMDDPTKVLSTEYDLIYFNETTEGTVEDWETLGGRLRNGKLPTPRLWGDCNPSHDRHWLLQRVHAGLTRMFTTVIQDNPAYFDDDGNPTPEGTQYLRRLDQYTGSRRERFVLGQWTGMENAIYTLERDKHILPCEVRPHEWGTGAIGVDYGDVHPNAVVAVQVGPTGRWWVRECRTTRDSTELEGIVRGMMQRFNIKRIRTDPNQAFLAYKLGGKIAKRGPGTRKERISQTQTLFDSTPATLVLTKDGEGMEDLWAELNIYRWEHKESATLDELQPVRIAEDRVAAMEYAVEELSESLGKLRPMPKTAAIAGRIRERAQELYRGI